VIVDAHHHLWDPGRREYPWMAGEALTPIRRPYTVDSLRSTVGPAVSSTILVQTVSSMQETEEFLTTADASDGLIAGVVGWVDLTAPSDLERLRTVPGGQLLVGIRHQVEDEPDPDWLLRKEVIEGLRAIGTAGLVYDLLVRTPQRPAAYAAAKQCPEVSFVLDHAGKPGIAAGEWEPWASWIIDLAGLPNVTCKLSGLITEAAWDTWSAGDIRPYAEHVLDRFGPDRVMFGSDWPVCELAGSYADVLTLTDALLTDASPSEREAVLSGTARLVYLGESPVPAP
jgi:L-fucono-1,5-lactonase